MALLGRLALLAIAAAIGLGAGFVGGSIGYLGRPPADFPFLAEAIPLPHHVPKYAGGVSLRFAMVHDILHERYPRAGPARYRQRERLLRDNLAKFAPDDPAGFPLADDLAGSLDRLGR